MKIDYFSIKKNMHFIENKNKIINKLLNKKKLTNWFIAYGTLLGIIRDNNTIDGDDDVDIIIDIEYKDQLVDIIQEIFNNFEIRD